jgi:acyl-CoA thioesterase FadM
VEEPAVINPKFVFVSPVRSLNADVIEHVDHAIIALDGRAPVGGDWNVEPLHPVADASALSIELWVNDLGDYTCTYGFLVSSEDGAVPYARGERTVVNIDARSLRAQSWSTGFRQTHAELLKDLPAYG